MKDTEEREIDDLAQDARVLAVLSAAAAPVEPGPLPGEDAALAAFGAHHRAGRKRMRSSLLPFKTGVAAAAVGAGVLFTGGVAAAATGTLPASAQGTVQGIFSSVGISVPGPNSDNANEHATAPHGSSGDHVPATDSTDETTDTSGSESGDTGAQANTDANQHGKEVSGLATGPDLQGVKKGAAVSALASGGKSKAGADHTTTPNKGAAAGDHSQAGDQSDAGEQSGPPADAGSQGTDASSKGQSTAEQARGNDDSSTGSGTGGGRS